MVILSDLSVILGYILGSHVTIKENLCNNNVLMYKRIQLNITIANYIYCLHIFRFIYIYKHKHPHTYYESQLIDYLNNENRTTTNPIHYSIVIFH